MKTIQMMEENLDYIPFPETKKYVELKLKQITTYINIFIINN